VVVSLAGVCWQFYHEVALLQYQSTLLCFASSHICVQFLQTKLSTAHVTNFSLHRLHHVQLDLGPAKYGNTAATTQNVVVLKQLAQEATSLQLLALNFHCYHRAATDILLLSHKVVERLL